MNAKRKPTLPDVFGIKILASRRSHTQPTHYAHPSHLRLAFGQHFMGKTLAVKPVTHHLCSSTAGTWQAFRANYRLQRALPRRPKNYQISNCTPSVSSIDTKGFHVPVAATAALRHSPHPGRHHPLCMGCLPDIRVCHRADLRARDPVHRLAVSFSPDTGRPCCHSWPNQALLALGYSDLDISVFPARFVPRCFVSHQDGASDAGRRCIECHHYSRGLRFPANPQAERPAQ
jgi:hypothetical protein